MNVKFSTISLICSALMPLSAIFFVIIPGTTLRYGYNDVVGKFYELFFYTFIITAIAGFVWAIASGLEGEPTKFSILAFIINVFLFLLVVSFFVVLYAGIL